MVRTLPNRYEDSSGVKPGARKLQMMPRLMPSVQKMAMAESSRMSLLRLNHCMPQAERTENTAADRTGGSPQYTPMPMPPNEA